MTMIILVNLERTMIGVLTIIFVIILTLLLVMLMIINIIG